MGTFLILSRLLGLCCGIWNADWVLDADMVETEQRKMKEREDAAHEQEERDIKTGKIKPKKQVHHEAEKKSEKKDQEHGKSKEAKK